jgi:hypothetical protein
MLASMRLWFRVLCFLNHCCCKLEDRNDIHYSLYSHHVRKALCAWQLYHADHARCQYGTNNIFVLLSNLHL